MRPITVTAAALTAVLTACSSVVHERPWETLVDLTHDFADDTIYWPTASGFEFVIDSRGMTEKGYWYEANTIRTAEHGGTHLDAPVHFAQGKTATEQIPLERLIAPAVVIDVRVPCTADRDYQVSSTDLDTFEREHGPIGAGTIVLLWTGFGEHWPDARRYLGTEERGEEAVEKLSFPGLHPSGAAWLVERDIAAVGIDTASIDRGASQLFETHRELFAQDIPVFENVAHLDRVPTRGATVIALPMKIRGGSGGPLRIVAAY